MGSQLFQTIEELVIHNRLYASLVSYASIALIFVNSSVVHSPVLGIVSSITFFAINTIFISRLFFSKEEQILRLLSGALLLIAFLGVTSWAIMIAHNLDEIRSTLALFIVATVSSLMSKLNGKRLF